MRAVSGLVFVLLVVSGLYSECRGELIMKRVPLVQGNGNTVNYGDLNLQANLYVYGDDSAAHLVGDVSVAIMNHGKVIASFYVDNDSSSPVYYSRIYRNYFLTLEVLDSDYNLVIEKSKFGKSFVMNSSLGTVSIDDLHIEIIDSIHEWSENESGEYDSEDVSYTLLLKVNDTVCERSFYSSEINKGYTIDVEGYSIVILSDRYGAKDCLIKMVVNR